MKKLLNLIVLAILITACDAITGKEVGRLPINQLSTDENLVIKETTLDLKKDEEIGIWSDMDIAYEGDVAMRFRVEIWRDTTKLGAFEVDPTDKNITPGEFRKTIGNKTEWSFSGKNSEYKAEEDGRYTFKGIFIASENTTLKVTKAEIVFKK